jgi:hypothetical protein
LCLGPTQPHIQSVPRALSLGVKRPRREADHSPPSSAEVKNAFMSWCLVKHRDNFTFCIHEWFTEQVFELLGIRPSSSQKKRTDHEHRMTHGMDHIKSSKVNVRCFFVVNGTHVASRRF